MRNIKKYWLSGDLAAKPNRISLMGALYVAREYFKGWKEKEIKECWNDLNIILKQFIKEIGRKSYQTNPITILSNEFMLNNFKPFEIFYNKWSIKFEKIKLHDDHPVYLANILLAVYLIKSAAQHNKEHVVIDAYDRLRLVENTSRIIIKAKKESLPLHCKSIATRKRHSTLNLVIIKILKTNSKMQWKQVLSILKTYVNVQLNIKDIYKKIVIKEINDLHIIWIDKNGKIIESAISGLPRRISGLRKNLR